MLVKQAANVLDLLEFFAARKRAATPVEVSNHFNWPRSSTFNLLSTLVSRGYLYEPFPRGGFYPTPLWREQAQEIALGEPLPDELLHLMEDMADFFGETVCLSGVSGTDTVFLEVIESQAAIRFSTEVGVRLPIHVTSGGQAIMSQMTKTQYASILRKVVFERYGEGTPMSIQAVETSIKQSLDRGWFSSASSYSLDLGGVSVPTVLNNHIFSLTVGGPLFRVEPKMAEIAKGIHRLVAEHLGAEQLPKKVKGLTTPPLPE